MPVCASGQTTNCPTETLVITVISSNTAPTAVADTKTIAEDGVATGNVLTNDTDVDAGTTLAVTKFTIGGVDYAAGTTATIPGVGTVVVNADGSYTFTPVANYNGTVPTITYTVTDGTATATSTLNITVTAVNDTPVPVADTKTIAEDGVATGNVLTNDTDVDAGTTLAVTKFTIGGVDYAAGTTATIPGVGTVVVNADGSYTFTPVANYNGTVPTITYTVTDGTATATSTLNITVTAVDPAPLITPDFNATNINVPVSGNLSTNDKIPTGGTYGTPMPASTNPTGGSITINPDGTYTFTGTTPGTYTYEVPVCAAGQTTNCPVTPLVITVKDPLSNTNAPIANTDVATLKAGGSNTINVLANDKSSNSGTILNPSSLAITVTPTHGTAVVNADGSITYTPAAGFVGTDSLTYKVCDNSVPPICTTAKVYYTVNPATTPSSTSASDDFTSTNGATPVSGNVLTNDNNSSGSTLKLTDNSVPLKSQGTIVFNTDGSYVFTAAPGFSGPVDITYTACTSAGVCATATLHILVDPIIATSVLKPDFNETLVNIPVTGNVSTNDNVPVGTTYGTPQPAISNPAGANFKMNLDGTYTFNSNTPGTYIYYVPVCNPGQSTGCPIVPIQITVIDPNVKNNPPIINPDIEFTFVNTPVNTNVLLNDKASNVGVELNKSSLQVSKNPANGKAIVNLDGTITFTPNPGFVGTDSLVYNICDNSTPTPNCKNAVVYYTIKPLGIAPITIATDDFASTYQNSTSGNILLNDKNTGSNQSSLVVTDYTKPLASQGVLVINPDGTYTFTPGPGFKGPIDIIYTVCGGTPKSCANATLHILVKPLIPTQIFDIKKSATGINVNLDGSYNINFSITIKNLTNEIIDSISVKDDLTKVFNDIKGVKVLSVTTSGNLTKNSGYDGIANVELLSISSIMNANHLDSINLFVNVSNNNSGTFLNTAILKAPMSNGLVDLASTDPARLSTDSTKRIPTLFIIPKIDFKIPEGFSPNNDGIDDTWTIIKPFGSKVSVKVFNRWGNEVYRSDDYKNDWRGKGVSNFLGEDVPEGTYYYIVEGTNFSGGVVRLAGPLTIKR